ncbi:MAG: helix-turn-helix domain-containing protein [Acidimicrobiia bacterium]|nr:helix-turn-helix domain-containing protein [Acidimicrobiia bacterium]
MSVHTQLRTLTLTRPEQLRAIGHPVRTRILQVLELEPASAKRISERLEMTHGKVGYHLKVLEREGLVEVVEERKVRAMTERLYAPTFDILRNSIPGQEGDRLAFLFEQAAREAAPAAGQPFEHYARLYRVRMTPARAAEFAARVVALADEFGASAEPAGESFGIAVAVYAADAPGQRS